MPPYGYGPGVQEKIDLSSLSQRLRLSQTIVNERMTGLEIEAHCAIYYCSPIFLLHDQTTSKVKP